MNNIPFKKIMAFTLFTVSINTIAANIDKEDLAQQCRDLSERIISLVSSQGKQSCVEKLGDASFQIETAGELIINDNNNLARQELDGGIYSLHYAELNNCNRYIQISHSKLEAQKIRSSLQ